jgi:hypothetical protein
VRLTHSLDSGTAVVEDRFEGTTLADVHVGGRVAIPAGAVARGVVTAVERATMRVVKRWSFLACPCDQISARSNLRHICTRRWFR